MLFLKKKKKRKKLNLFWTKCSRKIFILKKADNNSQWKFLKLSGRNNTRKLVLLDTLAAAFPLLGWRGSWLEVNAFRHCNISKSRNHQNKTTGTFLKHIHVYTRAHTHTHVYTRKHTHVYTHAHILVYFTQSPAFESLAWPWATPFSLPFSRSGVQFQLSIQFLWSKKRRKREAWWPG